MTKIRFTKSIARLLDGDYLLIVGTESTLRDGSVLDCLPEEHMRLALDLLTDLKPGERGAAAGTLTGSTPRKLAVGVLPDSVSRHNSPARAEAIRRVVSLSSTGTRGKAGLLLFLDEPDHLLPAANAIARALPMYHANKRANPEPILTIAAVGPGERTLTASAQVKTTVESSREAARLVDYPPSEMHPGKMQKEATRILRGCERVTRKAIVGNRLLDAGLGCLHAVGRTALEAPRLVVLTHKPKRSTKKHIALVGKGITYDTGGLSLKTGGHMVGMKSDMGGAAAALGAFNVLARSGCRHKLSAVLCLAENAVGPSAYKPDDILRAHSGLSVEVNNTDAEGRLVLADGVSYAARELGADTILDAATLTGAQLVATGKLHAGLMSNDGGLEELMVEAGRASGDLVHPLPFAPEFYKPEFSSAVADMRNSVANRANAQASCAGQFIYWHIEDTGARWAHVDLAGPSMLGKRATGFGVALLSEAVRRL